MRTNKINSMRINNKRIIPIIENLHILLFIALVLAIVLVFIPVSIIVNIIKPAYLIGLIVLMFYIFYKLGHQHFEYDSDGEVINVRTKNIFWSKYFIKEKTMMDFPKNKLISYKINNGIFTKSLEMYVSSKRSNNGMTKLKFNITYLNKTEVNDLKRSLNKIIKNNQQNGQNEVDNEQNDG